MAGGAYIVAYDTAVQWVARVTAPDVKGKAVGALVMAGYVGTSVSYLLVAGVLAMGLSWRAGYASLALPGILGIVTVWTTSRGQWAPLPSPGPAARWDGGRVSIGGFRVGLVIAGYAVHAAELFMARFWIPYALLDALSSPARTTAGAAAYLLSGLLLATGIPSAFLGGWLGDRVGTGRAAGGVLVSGGVLALMLLVSADRPVAFVLLSLAYCAILPADSAVLTSGVTLFSPPETLGRTQSIQAMSGFLAGAAVPALVGILVELIDAGQPWRVALSVNAVIAEVGAAPMFVLARRLGCAAALPTSPGPATAPTVSNFSIS